MGNNNFKSGLNVLNSMDMKDIQIVMNKGKNPKQCVNIDATINGKTTRYSTSSFNSEDFKGLFENLLNYALHSEVSMARAKVEKAWARGDEQEQLRTYVKESYNLGKEKLTTILDTAINDCSYSIDLLKTITSFDFKNTSAVLFRGNYVTPCMLEVVVSEWTKAHGMILKNGCAKEIVMKYLNQKY